LGVNVTVGILFTILILQVVGSYLTDNLHKALHGDILLVSMFKGAVRLDLLLHCPYLLTHSPLRSKAHIPALVLVDGYVVVGVSVLVYGLVVCGKVKDDAILITNIYYYILL
jgi:hypothetical protein